MPTHYQGNARETRALNTYIKLMRAADSVIARINGSDLYGPLTPSQFGVMEALFHLGPLNQLEIGKKILKSKANIVTIIDNLERQNLVKRQRDEEDRRFVTVSLTEKGHQLIAEIFPGVVAAIVEEMAVLTATEQKQLDQLCRKLGRKEG